MVCRLVNLSERTLNSWFVLAHGFASFDGQMSKAPGNPSAEQAVRAYG
jgi:hypothetical protein